MKKFREKSSQESQRLTFSSGTNFKSPFQLKASGGKKGGGGTSTSTTIKVKRNNIHLTGDDKYGHWWTELGPGESYGWWPKNPVGLVDTFGGTEGELRWTFGAGQNCHTFQEAMLVNSGVETE